MKTTPIIFIVLLLSLLFVQQGFAQRDTMEVNIDTEVILNQISQAPTFINGKSKTSNSTIRLLNLAGKQISYYVFETISIEEPLYSAYPQVRSYILIDSNDPSNRGRLSTGPDHINVMIKNAKGYEFTEPTTNKKKYKLFKGTLVKEGVTCGVHELEEHFHNHSEQRSSQTTFTNGGTLRTYRIAIATTGEFYIANGNNFGSVLAKINTYLNLLNNIFEDELAVHFNLIGNNAAIMFSDPVSDGLNPSNPVNSSQSVISGTIPAGDYELGHTFHTLAGPGQGGSGIANLGVICNDNFKAGGWTGATIASSDALWTGLWAHEIGHQFGAEHTMYGTEDNSTSFCAQRSAGHGYEPGSGNSLMSYEGICGSQNITPEVSTFYFHNHSLDQMITEMSTNSCQSNTLTGNSIPVTTAPINKTIPAETPFELVGSASDANGDPIYYNWEEFDTDNLTLGANNSLGFPNNAATSTTAPLFRSFDPSLDGYHRTFPTISDIVNDTQTQGEILPTVNRNMKFRLTARDFNSAGGAVSCDEVDLTVDATMGPFDVTSQATATTWTANGGNTATITWNVAGTNTICSNVDILFSTDRGLTFPYTLASSVTNNGAYSITVPSLATSIGRIKIKCSDNYFFDINLGDITINTTCDAVATTFSPDIDVTAIEGSSGLNLSLSSEFGASVSNFVGSLTSSDPASTLAIGNGSGGCDNFSNPTRYDTYNFQVSNSGNHTFTKSGPFGIVMSIYTGSFSASSPCANFISSSSTANTVTVNLTAGIEYVLLVSSFSATQPTLPANYTITPSPTVYDGTPPPPAGFNYTYVAVNQATNNVAAISASSNFTSLSPGTYSVYGLSYDANDNITVYNGGSFSTFQTDVLNLVICGAFSSNDITLTIQSNSNCPPNYSGGNALSGTENGTEDYETDGEIESTQIINAGATIDYDSGTSITLDAPFQVKLGAGFKAFIDGCAGAMLNENSSTKK